MNSKARDAGGVFIDPPSEASAMRWLGAGVAFSITVAVAFLLLLAV